MAILVRPRAAGVPADLGRPALPGSKSHAQRALLLAALRPGRTELRLALGGDDVEVLAAALQVCGARIDRRDDRWLVDGIDDASRIDAAVDVGENGTALRMLLMTVPALGGRLRIDGRGGLRRRPLAAALAALRAAGVAVSGDALPLCVDGGGALRLPAAVAADVTTQAASGALLARALSGRGGRLVARAPRAAGYLRLTAEVVRAFGIAVTVAAEGADLAFDVAAAAPATGPATGPAGGLVFAVPPDPSSRAFVAALAALHGGDGARALPPVGDDAHPDLAIDDDLRRLGAAARGAAVEFADLAARPDCVPALAAVAAARPGTTRLAALATLRGKESDRLAALAAGLAAAGARAEVLGDDLLVAGPLAALPAAPRVLPAPADHRIVMALALLGTVLPHGVVVPHETAVQKSWPGFWDWLGRCAEVGPGP